VLRYTSAPVDASGHNVLSYLLRLLMKDLDHEMTWQYITSKFPKPLTGAMVENVDSHRPRTIQIESI